ncbi:CaiB/BaiF CoA transferase family protein [Mesorhizobium sp. A556]
MMSVSSLPALHGIRVIDLSRVRAGPTCVRVLADFGADCIRVEPPAGVDANDNMFVDSRIGGDFQNMNRNKRSLTLNLKHPDGRKVLHRLVKNADVVVENWRPDVKYRLGADYESLRAVNPRIILASISGFGQSGPYEKRPGFDQIIQGIGGLMSVTGLPSQGPVRAGIAVADSSGGLFAAIGIIVALLERQRSGEGQWVHTSLLQSMIAMMDFQVARYLNDDILPVQSGNNHPMASPMGVFPASDGLLNLGVSGSGNWRRFCNALDQTQWLTDPRFREESGRIANREDLATEISKITSQKSVAHWVDLINAAGVPAGPVYSVPQMFKDPQIQHLNVTECATSPDGQEFTYISQPVRLERTPAVVKTVAPGLGEHTDQVLREVEYPDDEIAALRASSIV